jgi:hypothetical protein
LYEYPDYSFCIVSDKCSIETRGQKCKGSCVMEVDVDRIALGSS